MARTKRRLDALVDDRLTRALLRRRRVAGGTAGAVPLGCAIGLVLLLGAGGLTWHSSPTYGHEAQAKARNLGSIPVAAGVDIRAGFDQPLSPTRIDLPSLHESAPIVKVATSGDGELEIPDNPRTVGWWSPGARPGADKGAAIIAGHVNYAGVAGALERIGDLKPGDTFVVHGKINAAGKTAVTFQVKGVRTFHKTHLPYQEIFDQSSIGRVALVTCGGPFDNATGNYLDNIVVFAVPVSAT